MGRQEITLSGGRCLVAVVNMRYSSILFMDPASNAMHHSRFRLIAHPIRLFEGKSANLAKFAMERFNNVIGMGISRPFRYNCHRG
jgi:hypothetical protein